MTCRSAAAIRNGSRRCDGSEGDDGFVAVLRFELETVDDEELLEPWCHLPADGAVVQYRTRIWGAADDAAEGFYRLQEGSVARVGGTLAEHNSAFVGPSGWPGGAPAGWVGDATFVQNDPGTQNVAHVVGGAAGAGVVRWTVIIEIARLLNGATLTIPDEAPGPPPPGEPT